VKALLLDKRSNPHEDLGEGSVDYGLVRRASDGARAGHLAPLPRQPRALCWSAALLHPPVRLRGLSIRAWDLFSLVWLFRAPAAGERLEDEGVGYVPLSRLVLGLLVASRQPAPSQRL
jgi:hypothetical protein